MTDCSDHFQSLTESTDLILEDDLASLRKLSVSSRLDRYDALKANEEEFRSEFIRECPEFLTSGERSRVRSRFRLARLLIAASLYADGSLPDSIVDDFVESELEAVLDFERYKKFDVLSEEQIEKQIRRMEGEVYELVTEYTSTQLADIDALLDTPEVQQDVMEQLLQRYEDRLERIRHGFYVYVETHGLEHMVEAIEEAVRTVAASSDERDRVRNDVRTTDGGQIDADIAELNQRRRALESNLHDVERQLADREADPSRRREELSAIDDQVSTLSADYGDVLDRLEEAIDRVQALDGRLEEQEAELISAREQVSDAERDVAQEDGVSMIDSELESVSYLRDQLGTERDHLQRESDRLEATVERLADRTDDVSERITTSNSGPEQSTDADNAVTASMARLFEMDYIGRFEVSVREAETIHTPDGSFDVPDGYWDGRSEHRDERSRLQDLLDNPDDAESYPINSSARFEITTARYLGLLPEFEMVIQAGVLNHLEAYATKGFDVNPAGLDDLLEVVNGAAYEAERGGYHLLLGIASPTGWSDQVLELAENEERKRTRLSRFLSLCLVDLQDGTIVYNRSDQIVKNNVALFEHSTDAERVAACTDFLRSEYASDVGRHGVPLTEVVDKSEFEDHIVKQAFNRLEKEEVGEQLYLDEQGLCLDIHH